MPYLWLYGALGALAQLLRVPELLVYALANAVGVFAYMLAAHALLRTLIPRHANLAFLLFALAAGPGGLLYVLTGLAGMHDAPGFDDAFLRFALYELIEGAHLLPVTIFPRVYYTLSLAGCLGALTLFVQRRHIAVAAALLCAGAFINPRFGVFTGGLMLLWLAHAWPPNPRRLRALAAIALPGAIGFAVAWSLIRTSGVVVLNHQQVGDMAAWPSPFLSATIALLPLAGWAVWHTARRTTPLPRAALFAGCGYLAAYLLLFGLRGAYYGTLGVAREGSVAAAVSDPALLGGLLGAAWGWFCGRDSKRRPTRPAWSFLALWAIGFAALSVSGFGGGWFLRFGPQRLLVMTWLPLCALAACGLDALWRRRPAAGRAYAAVLVALGVCSTAVAVLYFQAPLGRAHAQGPYPWTHTKVMLTDDAALLDALRPGRVMAPPPASDIVVRAKRNPVYFGIGSFNLATAPYTALRERTDWFFSAERTAAERAAFLDQHGIRWVYCPATWPVPADVREALKNDPALRRVAERGAGVVFQVQAD
jgi:hypothetical protein